MVEILKSNADIEKYQVSVARCIVEKLATTENLIKINTDRAEDFLLGNIEDEFLKKIFSERTYQFENCEIPLCANDIGPFEDYGFPLKKIINKLGVVKFYNCDVYAESFTSGTPVLFDHCFFKRIWQLPNANALEMQDCLYVDCTFEGKVHSLEGWSEHCKYTAPQFKACSFRDKISVVNSEFLSKFFVESKASNLKGAMKNIAVEDSLFHEKFLCNEYDSVELVDIRGSKFKSKFEMKSCSIDVMKLIDTNVDGLIDFYSSKIICFEAKKCIFKGLSVFEKCVFGNNVSELNQTAFFEYVTFSGLVNFRSAEFCSGLKLDKANFIEEANFLDTEVHPKQTNRETFRIIKHSFDDVGNYLEGNKYFALEMKKYREEISNNRWWNQDRIAYWFNEEISGYGQNYFRPMELVIALGLINYLLMACKNSNCLYKILPELLKKPVDMIATFANDFAMAIFPIKRFLYPEMEFISLVSYPIFGVLFWQLIVAVKRHTRR
ncbi:hypothetical protein [Pelagibaculum spongiae]|uniref:Uncharacterized protein n=1 Tax=Pelagibaculum spongiae TaxID=2080658 RepID=A0A2V1H092_9GAMM|nr:hypothetical protein [Pelagibaculum spongiae]PVZ68413.1 hypothetical protein DC094_14135 [Pelagibaculum spongiae]